MSTPLAAGFKALPSAGTGVSLSTSGIWMPGSWVEVSASASAALAIGGLVFGGTWANAWFLIQIGIGAAGAETVVAEFYIYGGNSGSRTARVLISPVILDVIPNGSRIAARCWSASITGLALLVYETLDPSAPSTTKVLSHLPPVVPGTSGNGIAASVSSTAWANSAWVEFTSGLSAAIDLTHVVVSNPSPAQVDWEVDIGIGAAGSEVVIATIRGNNRGFVTGDPTWWPFPGYAVLPVSANTRIAGRVRRGTTTTATVGLGLQYLEAVAGGSTVLRTRIISWGWG